MSNIDRFLEMLQSNDPNQRYDACEQLRIASSIPEEALNALRKVTQDSNLDVANAARRALALHISPSSENAHSPIEMPNTADTSSSTIQAPSEKQSFNRWIAFGVGIGILGLLLLAGITTFTTQPPQPLEAQNNLDKQKGWSIPSTVFFTDLATDSQGKVWGITPNKGIASFNSAGDIEWITLDEKLTKSSAKTMAFDSKGRIWVGTNSAVLGVRELNGKWKTSTPEPPIEPNAILNIFVDGQDHVWGVYDFDYGSPNYHIWLGVADITNNVGDTYTFSNSGLNGNIQAAAVDKKGKVWVITEDYQLMVRGANGNWEKRASTTDNKGNRSEFSLAIDQQDLPWIGTYDRIYHLNANNQWDDYTKGNTYFFGKILFDHEGRVWGDSSEGIFVFDPSAGWIMYDRDNSGLKGDTVNAIAVDNENKIWIASDDLNIFDTKTASSVNILANQEAEQKYKGEIYRYQKAEQKKNSLRGMAYGLILVATLGIAFSFIPKEIRKFVFTFPPVQAIFIYLITLILSWLMPDLGGIGFIILIAFSILSPIGNLFATSWWLNTGLFLLSWYSLVNALGSAYEAHYGHSLGAGGMIIIPSMMAIAIVLPITALIKLIMHRSKKQAIHNKAKSIDSPH
jgi:hypothetical protein